MPRVARKQKVSKQAKTPKSNQTGATKASTPISNSIHHDITLLIESPHAQAMPQQRARDVEDRQLQEVINKVAEATEKHGDCSRHKKKVRMARMLNDAARNIMNEINESSDESDWSETCSSTSSSSDSCTCSNCAGDFDFSPDESGTQSECECDCSNCMMDDEYTLDSSEEWED